MYNQLQNTRYGREIVGEAGSEREREGGTETENIEYPILVLLKHVREPWEQAKSICRQLRENKPNSKFK